jgi:hypothetical protein
MTDAFSAAQVKCLKRQGARSDERNDPAAEIIEVSTAQLEDVVRLEDKYGRAPDAVSETR